MQQFVLDDVCVNYGIGNGCVNALKNISLKIDKGEKMAIVGNSGSGKSTLLNVLSGIEKISNGKIFYESMNYGDLKESKKAKIRINQFGFVFQSFYLISSLTVYDNIRLPVVAENQKIDEEFFESLVSQLGLQKRVHHLPSELSGGEKQRVALARALINKPDVIFADEPSGNLDSKNGDAVFKLLFQMSEQYGQTLIYVTHDIEKAELAKRKITLRDGEIINDEVQC